MPVHSINFRSDRSALSRVLKWVGIALAALVALFLLAAAALLAFGGDWLRGPVERAALEKTGRALNIAGDIRLGFGWPLKLRVHVGQVAFANAAWAKQPPDMLTADEIDLVLALPSLLTGHPVIDELRLRKADVTLETDAQGRKNWELPGGPSKLSIQRMALDDSRIDYREPARNTSLRAEISATQDRIAFTAKGSYFGEAAEARGSGGPLLALRDESEPYPFEVELSAGPSHVKARGTVTGLQNVSALDANVDISGGSLDQLYHLVGIALPKTPAYRSTGRVVHQGKTWRYEKFSLHAGQSDVNGTLEVDTSGRRPAMSGDAVFGLLDVRDLGATVGTDEPRSRALPESKFKAGRWSSVDADVRLSARQIVRPHELPLEHFAARLRLRDAVLTLDPLEFGIAGGRLAGTVTLDGRREPIRARARIKVADVALDRLVPGFDTAQIETGRIDGDVDLAGSGDSVAQMLGGASGSVALLVNGGHVSRLLMEEIGLHLPRIVLLKLGGDQRIAIRCGAADFRVEDGVAHARTGILDTAVTRIDAGGDIDLDSEELDLTLTPHTKEAELISLHGPVHIRGTFDKPDVQLEKGRIAAKSAGAAALALANPLLALIPLMETGPGTESDCGRLLNASQAAADAGKKTPGAAAPPKR